MVFWPGPHGGLTVVHGGGNTALQIDFEMRLRARRGPNTITRLDGLSWIDAGFSLGQRVQVERRRQDAHDHRLRQRALPVRRPVPELRPRQHDAALRRRLRRQPVNADEHATRPIHVADAETVVHDRR